jgi:hypothetical protein
MVIFGNNPGGGLIIQANAAPGSNPGLDGIEVRIDDFVNITAHIRVTRRRPSLLSLSDGSEATESCLDLIPVRLSVYALKIWAILWLTKEASVDGLLALCTEGLIDGKTGDLEDDRHRAAHIRDLDNGIADLLNLGLLTAERAMSDGLDQVLPGGATEKALKRILERREIMRHDIDLERSRLSHRLEQLGGTPEPKPAKAGKKSTEGV